MNLKTFNFYQYIKDRVLHKAPERVFLADENMYRELKLDFPFRTTHYGIGFNYGVGQTQCRIGSQEYRLSEGSVITVGPGIVTQWQGNYQLRNKTLFFCEELLADLGISSIRNEPCFHHGGNHVVNVGESELRILRKMFSLISSFIDDEAVLTGLVFSLFRYVGQLNRTTVINANSGNIEQIVIRFRSLLARDFIESKEVGHYAGLLNLSPQYLSEILREATGKSAKELITDQVIWEAKSLLKQTNMTVQEISYWLGYDDQSYFTRMFKKRSGITPAEYRRQ